MRQQVRAGVFRPMTFGDLAIWRGVDSVYECIRLQTTLSDFEGRNLRDLSHDN